MATKKISYNSRPQLIVLISIVIASSIYNLHTSNLEWETASIERVSQSLLISKDCLLLFRWLATILIFGVAAWSFFDPQGLRVQTKYLPESSLSPKVAFLKGKYRCATFTVWCWYLLGFYFLSSSMVSTFFYENPPTWLLRSVWVLYEISFACSILVTTVVTFILLPYGKKDVLFMLRLRPLLMHNANVFMTFSELLFNGLSINSNHIPFTVLWGCLYVVFAWIWQAKTGVYFYPFLDHTLRWWKALGCHIGLIMALMMYHVIGVKLSLLLSGENYHFSLRAGCLYSLVALITKFKE